MKPQKARPTALPVLFDNIPDELRATPSWVAWCYELDARGDWTKPPCRVRGRGRASTTDPRTWATFAEARAAYEKGGFDGIGVVLTNGIAGIDPDHAIDGDGAIKPWAAEVLDKFKGTYRERSPSGEGFRIFVHGQPKHCGKGGPDNHLEVYAKDSPRYLTVTGHALDDVRVIADKQDALDWLHATHMQRASRPRPTGATQSAAKLSDDDVIKCAREARNGGKFSRLWSGDTREYGDDHSTADAALVAILAYWTGKDHAQIDRLFRRSGLMRAKWDSRRGDSTYGDCTIAEIVARTQETIARSIGRYDPAADDSTADDAPAIIIGGALIEATKLPPARYVTRPLLVSGQLGTLTGHPGHAKTTFVVGMFVAFAADLPFGPLQPESDGLLYIVSAEDFEGTKNRILAEAARLRLNVDARARVNARLRWARVAAIASPSTIREAIERDAAGRSIAAIFIDTGPALFPGDDENDNVALRDYLNGLLHFRALPGHPAVVVAWHPSKGAGPDRLEPRGASSIKGTGDFNLTIWKDDDGRVTVSYTKMRAAHFDPIEAALGSVDLTDDDGERFSVPVIDIAAAAVADRTDSREAREAILRHLYAHRSDPPTIRDTAAATGLSRAAVGRHLRYLAGARPAVVEMDPVDERYKLTTKGEARARMLAERSRRAYADIRG